MLDKTVFQTRYHEIRPEEISRNVFDLIGKDWLLVTGGTPESFNSMTASWGGLGVLWNKPVAFVFIRKTRHTLSFLEEKTDFSLSVYPESCRKELLNIFGKKSGRDCDKVAESGFTPVETPFGTVAYAEASLVMSCKKLYAGQLVKDNILDQVARTTMYAPDEEAIRFYSLQRNVTPETPPAFIWHTAQDASVPAVNSMLYAAVLQKNGVPYELHIFPFGAHGKALAENDPSVGQWKALLQEWMGAMNL